MPIFVLEIDLDKNVCSLVWFDETGAVVLRRRLAGTVSSCSLASWLPAS